MTSKLNTTDKTPTTVDQVLSLFPTVELLNKELKRTASLKCRYSKNTQKANQVPGIIEYETLLKAAKTTIKPAAKTTTTLTADDIASFDYDQTVRAIKSIQSKKSNSKYLTSTPGDNDTYRKACEIERLLLDHKATLAPASRSTVSKAAIADLFDRLKSDPDLDVLAELSALL